jgi:hypothetical protein
MFYIECPHHIVTGFNSTVGWLYASFNILINIFQNCLSEDFLDAVLLGFQESFLLRWLETLRSKIKLF